MLSRKGLRTLTTWVALLGLGHHYNVWVGVLGALAVNIILQSVRED